MARGQTPSQTVGPFFAYGLAPEQYGYRFTSIADHAVAKPATEGEHIRITGQVFDGEGTPIPDALLEFWQANACGRYIHEVDQHDAPIDPNFLGAGRCVTDSDGRYRFISIKPGAYPWGNHHNAWRPNHIHLSLFGPTFTSRLVTQMYFPGDPLLPLDPIFNGTPEGARERLIASFAIDVTEPEWALGYTFDIVLRGPRATPVEH